MKTLPNDKIEHSIYKNGNLICALSNDQVQKINSHKVKVGEMDAYKDEEFGFESGVVLDYNFLDNYGKHFGALVDDIQYVCH